MSIRAEIPPRSPADIPSTSSIIRRHRVSTPRNPIELLSLVAFSGSAIDRLFLTSLAFSSIALYDIPRETSRARVVLPIPGGPVSSAARALMFT